MHPSKPNDLGSAAGHVQQQKRKSHRPESRDGTHVAGVNVAIEKRGAAAKWPADNTLALIVDDKEWLRTVLSRLLGALGVRSIQADGETAIEAYSDAQPEVDFVFLDVNMPVLDGYAVFRHIRSMSATVVVIFCTSDLERCVRNNVAWDACTYYLPKPYTFVDLENLLASIGDRIASE